MSVAWTTVKTWATGDDITASLLNAHLRDNTSFLFEPPCARAFNSAAISHTSSGSFQALTFNSERFDTDVMHSTSVSTGRLTATKAGKYDSTGAVVFAPNSTGVRALRIRLNGATAIGEAGMAPMASPDTPQLQVSTLYALAAADYLELLAYQASGGSLNINATGNVSPEFWAAWQSN